MKIYLFRHGETNYNHRGIFTGWRDSKLSKEGVKDAKIVAEKLKNKKIDLAYQSDLSRSKDTLKIVLKYHKNVEVITDWRIKERSYGLLEGKSKKRYAEKYPKKYPKIHRGYADRPPKGESIKDVEKRVNGFIQDLVKKVKKEKVNVAISAHGNSMRPLRKYFEKLSIKEMCSIENPYDDYFVYTI